MSFLKRHLFNLICGLVAAGSIALGVFGLMGMSKVTDELQKVASIHGQFPGPMRKPINDQTISAERQRVETIRSNYKALIKRAYALNRYEPMQPPEGELFFPEPTRDGRLEFPKIYREQFEPMLQQLKSGSPPTQAEIDQMQDLIEEEKAAAMFRQGDDQNGDRGSDDQNSERPFKCGLISAKEAWNSAASRAAIQKARSIYCYASRDSIDENTKVYMGLSPNPIDMWDAQMTLWIQQDVVDALARVNEESATELKAAGIRPWVGTLPIKDVISIRVSDYLPHAAQGSGPDVRGDDPSFPPGTSEVFTKNSSTDLYDLVQFTVKLVVDARDVLRIIDAISKNRFHTLLNVSYAYDRESLESLRMVGKIYGSEPTVQMVLDFETIFFGDIYRRLMPDAVLGKLGKERPVDEDKTS